MFSVALSRLASGRTFGLVVMGVVAAFVVRHFFGTYAIDDSYIGYVNARNLAHGLGFSFNTGDRLLTTSAPLVIPLYALLDRVGFGEVFSGQVLSAISYSIVCLLSLTIARRLTCYRVAALGAAIVFVVSPPILLMWSHETLLWVALVLVSFQFYFSGQFVKASLLLGISALARPETMLLLPFVTSVIARISGFRRASSLCGIALIPFLAWTVYAVPTFGTPISNSVFAKHAQLMAGEEPYLYGLLTSLPRIYSVAIPTSIYLCACCATILGLVAALMSRLPAYRVILGWSLVVTIAYIVMQVHFFIWFGTQASVLESLAFLSLATAFNLNSHNGSISLFARALVRVSCVTILFAHCWFFVSVLTQPGLIVAYDASLVMPEIGANSYDALARYVGTHTTPGQSIAYPEIGQLRFYSDRPVIDYYGLATAGAAQHVAYGDPMWTFERYRPNVFVDAVGTWRYIVAPLEYAWFAKAYTRAESLHFDSRIPGKSRFILYRLRNPAAIPVPEEVDREARVTSDIRTRSFAVRSVRSLSAIDVRINASDCRGDIRLTADGLRDIVVPIRPTPYSEIVRTRVVLPLGGSRPGLTYVLHVEECSLDAVRAPQALRKGFVLWNPARSRGPKETAINAYYVSAKI